MKQIRPGDFIFVARGDAGFVFAILTKQIVFGGHWCYVFHDARSAEAASISQPVGFGFNAIVDFITPNRENHVIRLSRGNDLSSLMGPDVVRAEPAKGEVNHQIWRWRHGGREEADWVRFTPSPTVEELAAPSFGCIPAEWACRLAERRWEPRASMWAELDG